MLATIIESV
jgi:hypothetical protein